MAHYSKNMKKLFAKVEKAAKSKGAASGKVKPKRPPAKKAAKDTPEDKADLDRLLTSVAGRMLAEGYSNVTEQNVRDALRGTAAEAALVRHSLARMARLKAIHREMTANAPGGRHFEQVERLPPKAMAKVQEALRGVRVLGSVSLSARLPRSGETESLYEVMPDGSRKSAFALDWREPELWAALQAEIKQAGQKAGVWQAAAKKEPAAAKKAQLVASRTAPAKTAAPDALQVFRANLKHAAFNREQFEVGGGLFDARDVLAAWTNHRQPSSESMLQTFEANLKHAAFNRGRFEVGGGLFDAREVWAAWKANDEAAKKKPAAKKKSSAVKKRALAKAKPKAPGKAKKPRSQKPKAPAKARSKKAAKKGKR